ncbi:hypothetical protein E4U53_006336 [Claviceps sorghi]|nr:hypothetical protein E4U53_006336 [Claviceps sorghi]
MHLSTSIVAALALCVGQTLAKCSYIQEPAGAKAEVCPPGNGFWACHGTRITPVTIGTPMLTAVEYRIATAAQGATVKVSCSGTPVGAKVMRCDAHSSMAFGVPCKGNQKHVVEFLS